MKKKDKENIVRRANKTFKLLKWLFVASAILSCISMIFALVNKEVTISNYIMKCIDSVLNSLLLAFIFGRTKVKENK